MLFIAAICSMIAASSVGQTAAVTGSITAAGKPVAFASVTLVNSGYGILADSSGRFRLENVPAGSYHLYITCIGYMDYKRAITLKNTEKLSLSIQLIPVEKTLNEVFVVTGVSKATTIAENPVSIVNVSPKVIGLSAENNIIDVLVKNVPGLNAVKTGPNISKPFIRGLGYNRVLTLYDGIRQEGQQWGDEHGIEVDAYNIDRAEVIKGPASLMYGSDALAGVVSLFPVIPNKYDGKLHGKISGEYQTNNKLVGNGLLLDYSDKHFLFAMRGSYRFAKNYRNAIDGSVYNTNFKEKNFSALFGYKTSKGYTHLNVTVYDNLQGIPDGSRDSLTRKFTYQVYEGARDTIQQRPVVPEATLNSWQLSPLHQHIQHYRIYLRNSWQIKNGDIDLLLALQQNKRREYNHPTMPEQPGMYVRLNTLNYGWQYNAPKFSNIETSIGINGMLQDNKSINATDFPIPDYKLFDGGVFLYAKWKSAQWTISGGIRYDTRRVQWNDFYAGTDPVTGFSRHVDLPDTAGAVLQFPAYKKSFDGISASIGFTYKINEAISIKANVGQGYRAPNITEMAANGLDPGAHIIYLGNPDFKPEFSVQEDIGVLAKFKHISADVSLFNNNIQHYIYLGMIADANGEPVTDAQGNKTYQYQQAAARLYGMEAWLSIHPGNWKGFSFDNSFAAVYGFNRKDIYKGKGDQGEYLPLIPPPKLLSSISQKIQTKSSTFTTFTPKVEVECSAAQNRFLGLNNTENYTPAYTLVNMGFAAEIKYARGQPLQLQLQVNNLFNKAYQSNLSRLKYFEYYNQSPNGKPGIYNMGRNICLKTIFPF
jgi:iron complex outermembrane receptor protein